MITLRRRLGTEGPMRRREFIGGLGSGLILAPLARAQQSLAKKRIAFVLPAAPSPYAEVFYKEFLEELRRRGFAEPDNLVVDRFTKKVKRKPTTILPAVR